MDARQDRDRALAELKAAGSPRTAAEVRPLLGSALKLAGNCARIETATQREACKALPLLQTEVASHERKLKAESALAAANHRIASAGSSLEKVADPLAMAISTYATLLGTPLTPDQVAPLLALVPMMLLEIGSMFAVVATRSQTEKRDLPDGEYVAQSPVSLSTPPAVLQALAPPDHATEHQAAVREAVGKITAIAAERGGTLHATSKREIARLIETSPPTASRALAALTATAAVSVDQTGICIRLLG